MRTAENRWAAVSADERPESDGEESVEVIDGERWGRKSGPTFESGRTSFSEPLP
jgi:hypothetical protein